LQYIKYVMGIQ